MRPEFDVVCILSLNTPKPSVGSINLFVYLMPQLSAERGFRKVVKNKGLFFCPGYTKTEKTATVIRKAEEVVSTPCTLPSNVPKTAPQHPVVST